MVCFFQNITDLVASINGAKMAYSKVFILCDSNTARLCLPRIKLLIDKTNIIEIPAGEANKNLGSCSLIWDKLTSHYADRNTLMINLGGGMVTDIGGYAAGCYKRGIDCINVPTSLLAMVDASVGGKTGIDFMGFKNQIGIFNEATHTFICQDFLATLPLRELLSGYAEIVKHYFIADKKATTKLLEIEKITPQNISLKLIKKAISIKAKIVKKDPLENGVRKTLNFGHTVGHALESYYLDTASPLLHGEAIAMGMAVEIFVAKKILGLRTEETEYLLYILGSLFTFVAIPDSSIPSLLSYMAQDKKNSKGIIKMATLSSIGKCEIEMPVTHAQITKAIAQYNSWIVSL